QAEIISDDSLRIIDDDARMLTPSSVRIEKNTYIKVRKKDDGVYEFLARIIDPSLRGRKSTLPPKSFFGEGFLIGFLIIFAGVLFCVSAVIHFSTYFASSLFISKMDNVWLLHILIFPPFVAAIFLSRKWGSSSNDDDGQDLITNNAPKWLRLLSGTCFAYALVNFILFMIFSGGGGPGIDNDGKYVMESHGRTLKVITRQEYKDAQALVVRGFSGHWLLFYSASVLMLVGVAELRRRKLAGEYTEAVVETAEPDVVVKAINGELDFDAETKRCNKLLRGEKEVSSLAVRDERKAIHSLSDKEINRKGNTDNASDLSDADVPQEYSEPEVLKRAAVAAISAYIISVCVIISDIPFFVAILAPFLCVVGIKSLGRLIVRSKRKNEQFHTVCGCLSVVPNFFLAGILARSIVKLICVSLYADFTQALMGTVKFAANKTGPYVLTNGATVDLTFHGAASFAGFALTVLFLAGLTGLMEYAGRGFKL
ncbi:MAG: hypothetical protein KAG97_10805, partial [Victivallales bacterium]|nr:hypothetical protein [Victivallales bacterium]